METDDGEPKVGDISKLLHKEIRKIKIIENREEPFASKEYNTNYVKNNDNRSRYNNWKNSQKEMNIKDIRAIVDLRKKLNEKTQHDISFQDIVIKPSIAEDTALTTYYVDNITQDYSANINIINSISAMTTIFYLSSMIKNF
jgi:hypothetical protein